MSRHAWVSALAALATGALFAALATWTWVIGPLRSIAWGLLVPASLLVGVLGLICTAIGALGRGRGRTFLALLALGLLLLPELPVPWLAGELAAYEVARAKAYCAALDTGGAAPSRPALAEPGYSQRYPFSFRRDAAAASCLFPSPLAARAAWHGGRTTGPWRFELLMD